LELREIADLGGVQDAAREPADTDTLPECSLIWLSEKEVATISRPIPRGIKVADTSFHL
jgi:hypothetical protein